MRQYMPYVSIVAILVILVAGWWYEYSMFGKVDAVVSTTTVGVNVASANLSAASINADAYVLQIKKYGQVPLTADGLPRSPQPLFATPSQ